MLEYLTKEDLPDSMVDIAEVIGIDGVRELIRLVGGSSVYVPSEGSVVKPIRNCIIRESFRGNYKELSKKFGISEVQIRHIVNS